VKFSTTGTLRKTRHRGVRVEVPNAASRQPHRDLSFNNLPRNNQILSADIG
jgi:hypothetical protein